MQRAKLTLWVKKPVSTMNLSVAISNPVVEGGEELVEQALLLAGRLQQGATPAPG